ncbi:MAG: zinc-binding dehydrogenase, partial [Labilithrix sp.]|nr:zinc-binding dehydrogenase [Labilithrix sp.]
DEAPAPPLGPKEARIRVELAGVNYGDVVLRSGKAFDAPRPYVPGTEAAGVVTEIGAEVHDVAVGASVAAPLFTTGRLHGGYASEVVFDAERLVPLPDDISWEAAIALQVQGISAWLMFDHVAVRDRSALVHAGAGGVGSLLLQIARLRGANRVLATASTPDKRALVRELGADDAIDYTDGAWPEQVLAATDGRGADVIVDSVGGVVRKRSFEALAVGGTLVLLGYSAEASDGVSEGIDAATLHALFFKRQSVRGFMWTSFEDPKLATRTMLALFEEVRRNTLRVVSGGTFALDLAGDAHRALEARATTGKITLRPKER